MRESEAPEGDAGPEAGGDVAYLRGVAAAGGDEVGDYPAGVADFGALVGEDEEGSSESCTVGNGGFEEVEFAGLC